MASEWRETTLGEICGSQGGSIHTGPFGSQLHASDYKVTGIPVVMPANIGDNGIVEEGIMRIGSEDADRLEQHKLNIGDVVFSRRGDVTRNALIQPHEVGWLCGTGCLKVRLGNESRAKAKFISYCLRLPETKEWLVRHAVGATMPNLNTSILSAVPMLLPPMDIQEQISGMLGAIDEKVTLLRETNTTLEAIAQALFKSWFVDFDPVRAKAEGRDPEGVPPEMADLFPSEFEDSELGAIPKGWKAGTLEVFAELNPESWSNKNHPERILYVDLANAKENRVESIAEFSFEEAPSRARRVLRDGDTIVGTVRPGNRSFAFIQEPPPGLTGSTGFAVLRPRKTEYTEFIFLAATRTESIDILSHLADGGAYPAVRPEVVQRLQVVVPPDTVLQAFRIIASSLMRRVGVNNLEADNLADLRGTLLPRLMSGDYRFSEDNLMIPVDK